MIILSIDTSADETAVAVTTGRKVISNAIFSQIATHTKWGGIYPALAKRAHEERIDWVVGEAIKKVGTIHELSLQKIGYIAVTQGPGLAIALEVGIKKAKELAQKYSKKIIAVNHLEGHIYSCFVQNSAGNPKREFEFPYLALIVSGGHTILAIFKDHLTYEILGETQDDAAGEALDKAAKMLGLGYPGGPVIERLASQVENKDFHKFPRPMSKSKNVEFSFSGLKTSFFYYLNKLNLPQTSAVEERSGKTAEVNNLAQLASSFQAAVFDSLLIKTELTIKQTGINKLVVGGGVIANMYLRKLLRDLVKKHNGEVIFPPFKYLTGDNAAMIGVVAHYKAKKNLFVSDLNKLDRIPRLELA